MPEVTLLTQDELRRLVPLDLAAINCVEQGFKALAGGQVVMPPILSMAIAAHNGEVDVKTAYVPGIPSFAIKMSPGFFDNPTLGLPSTSGLMVVFSAKTGMLEALLLDNGYLTDIRTAAAGAVAANCLARPESKTSCIIGAGTQAKLQLKALCLVREIQQAKIWARDTAKAAACAKSLSLELNIPITVAETAKHAVQGADIIVTTTPSASPLIQANWLQPGQHITAMGSDQDHKCELEPACLARADLYVPDRQSQTSKLGELRSAIAANHVADTEIFPELGDIIAGKAPGRQSAEQITIADLTGTGLQDTVIAAFARQRAQELKQGSVFRS